MLVQYLVYMRKRNTERLYNLLVSSVFLNSIQLVFSSEGQLTSISMQLVSPLSMPKRPKILS